jgi:predicted nucleic acid-binding protein
MHLALTDLFRARWSAEIHEEWIRSVLRARPDLDRAQLERTRQLMDTHARDACVTGYANLIASIELPDPDDRHVLAAAIVGRADVIVTYNLKDFPDALLDAYGIEAQHPDVFLQHLMDLDPPRVIAAVKRLRETLRHPPVDVSHYIAMLERCELPAFAGRLREFEAVL